MRVLLVPYVPLLQLRILGLLVGVKSAIGQIVASWVLDGLDIVFQGHHLALPPLRLQFLKPYQLLF